MQDEPEQVGEMLSVDKANSLDYCGDRFGRRIALIGCVVAFGLATIGTAMVHGLAGLTILRFVTGMGTGGALPNASALTAEFAPLRRRAMAVKLTLVCFPLGGMLGGLLAAWVLPRFVAVSTRFSGARKNAPRSDPIAPEGVVMTCYSMSDYCLTKSERAVLSGPDGVGSLGLSVRALNCLVPPGTPRPSRPRGIIAVLLGCGLRRSEVAVFTYGPSSGEFTPAATSRRRAREYAEAVAVVTGCIASAISDRFSSRALRVRGAAGRVGPPDRARQVGRKQAES